MSKIKKLIALSLCALMGLTVACDNGAESSKDSSSAQGHVCVTEGTWKKDSTGHWLECSCGEIVDYGSHTGAADNCGEKPTCDVCGAEFGEVKLHNYGGRWRKDSTAHWLECDCGKIAGYASHTTTVDGCGETPTCDVCGAEFGEPKPHNYGELTNGAQGLAYYCDCGDFVTNEDLVDFVVEVESGRDPVVLQLSDTQITSQGNPDDKCYRYIREVVQKTNPDLIVLAGDLIYGSYDTKGTILLGLIEFMETLKTPWAPIFGNHDNESLMGVDWQCAQLEAAEYCLFKQGDLTGNGNYTVGIEQDGELLRVFYMMDSNGCSRPMLDENKVSVTPPAGTNVVKTTAGFGADQVLWLGEDIANLKSFDEDIKFSIVYHIQQQIFGKAFEKYGALTPGSSALKNTVNLDTLETAEETDFGYIGAKLKGPWDTNNEIFYKMKGWGIDSIFVGHEHNNSASIVYEGVRLQYGQKSSTYDRYNVLTSDGQIKSNADASGTPIMGGTVIPISRVDGSIGTGYIVYYGNPFNT